MIKLFKPKDNGLYLVALEFERLEKVLKGKFEVDDITLRELSNVCYNFRCVGRRE